jgi:tetratricopeptide (TPR) repeat protein
MLIVASATERSTRFALTLAVLGLTSLACTATNLSASPRSSQLEDPPSTVVDISPTRPPQTPMTAEESGDLQLARKHYQAAIQSYRQISTPTAITWNKIGMANQQMFNMPEAKKSYEAALRLSPKNADVINNLGTVYFAQRDYGAAERLYKRAIKANPKAPLIYKNLGTVMLAQDKFKKGWDYYQQALNLDPDVFEHESQFRIEEPTAAIKRGAMNYYLAKSYLRAGLPDKAVNYLRMAIDQGYTDRKKVFADTEFASLHDVQSFQQLIADQQLQ